jgi:hypothetical protein
MSSTPELKSSPVTVQECRNQARECLQKANKNHAEARAAWLKLAERWLEMAERIRGTPSVVTNDRLTLVSI